MRTHEEKPRDGQARPSEPLALLVTIQLPSKTNNLQRQALGDKVSILISASRQIDKDRLVRRHFLGSLHGIRYCVGTLESRNDSLDTRQRHEGIQTFLIGNRYIVDTTNVFE